jgi:putative DNA primase/helicase
MSRASTTYSRAPIDWKVFAVPGRWRIPCPMCGRGPRDDSMSLTRFDTGFGLSHCFRCKYVEYDVVRDHARMPKSQTCAAVRPPSTPPTGMTQWARDLWSDCQPIYGVAAAYLRGRRCMIPPTEGDLRWHPELRHPSGHVGPALVALITNVHTGERLSLQRTWITETGKAGFLGNRVRMLLPGHSTANGVIRLWPDGTIQGRLGIGEGIETALSIGQGPVWSTLDAGHLARFPVIDGVEDLYIARCAFH